jgi:hypothetical protein
VRITGGDNATSTSGGNGNRVWFDSHGDTIRNGARGGMAIQGGNRAPAASGVMGDTSSDNRVHVELFGTTFANNRNMRGERLDLVLIGALGNRGLVPGPADVVPGQNNVVEALLRHVSNQVSSDGTPGRFLVLDSSLPEPSNRVVLRGSSVSFEHTNEGLDVPADEFFGDASP